MVRGVMEIKQFYKKDKDGHLVMTNGRVIARYKERVSAKAVLERAIAAFSSLGLSSQLPELSDIDVGVYAEDIPKVEGVRVIKLSKKQNFSQKFIDKSLKDGYASMIKGEFILHTIDGDLTFKIIQAPGYFCCHDNKALGGEKEAKDYVGAYFKDVKSPDTNNPAGYRKDNFHACELQGGL